MRRLTPGPIRLLRGAALALGLLIGAVLLSALVIEALQPRRAIAATPDEAVRAATATCRPGSTAPARGVLGLSDPHADEPGVIDLIAATGVRWVRAELYWSQIEPVAGGGYRWGRYDAMIRAYAARGIRVQAILTYVPPAYLGKPQRMDTAFQAFAAAAVRRYGAMGVHHWEVFNEPNLPGYGWLTRRFDTRENLPDYALLLARANRAVRENDPRGVVILGGLASDQHRGLPIEETMQRLYDLGVAPCFDVMAFHPYGYQGRFPEARARVDAVLRAHGDSGKPVWFNEYGWTEQAAMDLSRNPDAGTNPMLAALEQGSRAAEAFFWFSARDYSAKRGTPAFGLATADLVRRPSFETFRHHVTGQ